MRPRPNVKKCFCELGDLKNDCDNRNFAIACYIFYPKSTKGEDLKTAQSQALLNVLRIKDGDKREVATNLLLAVTTIDTKLNSLLNKQGYKLCTLGGKDVAITRKKIETDKSGFIQEIQREIKKEGPLFVNVY